VAGTDPDTAAAVRSPTLRASTIPREAVPDPSPAGEPPDMSATDQRPTGAGTTRDTAAASATEARREAGTGRDGNLSQPPPASGWYQHHILFNISQILLCSFLRISLVFAIVLSSYYICK